MGNWINVKDKLPDLETVVFAGWFDDSGEFCWDKYVRVHDDGFNCWLWSIVDYLDEWQLDDDYSCITHWQYLPAPPETSNEME